jgi:hypothetical protein
MPHLGREFLGLTIRSSQAHSSSSTETVAMAACRGLVFSLHEHLHLLDIVTDELPILSTAWEHVTELHKEMYPEENSTANSLKQKFNKHLWHAPFLLRAKLSMTPLGLSMVIHHPFFSQWTRHFLNKINIYFNHFCVSVMLRLCLQAEFLGTHPSLSCVLGTQRGVQKRLCQIFCPA